MSQGLQTQLIHAPAPHANTRGTSASLDLSSSFQVDPTQVGFSAMDLQTDAPLFYARWQNPTVAECEVALACLEQAEASLCFASGMAAISAVLLQHLSAGDHVILPNVCYAAVLELGHDTLPRFGIDVSFVDTSDLDTVAAAFRPNTRLLHLELPNNPILRLCDLPALCELAHSHHALVSVDATIASPLGVRPLALGADFSIHSLTKYISGHGDVLGGVVSGSQERIAKLRQDAGIHFGGCMHPMAAWLTLRSLATLSARMAMHQNNAQLAAEFLQNHPKVSQVLYPGLPSHPQYALAQEQLSNSSGLLSFCVKGDYQAVQTRLLQNAEVFTSAISLGKSHSLMFYLDSHALQASSLRLPEADFQRYQEWAKDGVFRTSIGLENTEDILADLARILGD